MSACSNSTNGKKMEADYDDELNCVAQTIVHTDGDHRVPITESMYNKEGIIKCIGQLETKYKYIEKGYEQRGSSWGTGTVFKVHGNKCYILTAACNIRKKIKECFKCKKYMERNIMNCIHCNHDKLEYKLISATTIMFRRREVHKHVAVYNEEQKETMHYEFGDNRKCYLCRCEYIDPNYDSYPFPTAGYDYCVLSFINDDGYNYAKYAQNITIKNELIALNNKSILRFNIYGYPMYMTEREKHYKMYGMESTSNNYSVEVSKNSGQYYLKQHEIDSSGGQAGASIWYKNKNTVTIFATHVGGNAKKKYNAGQIINDEILTNISNITSSFNWKNMKTQFLYKRAQETQQIDNIGVVMSDYGEWSHQTTGFIFLHSSTELYALTEAQAVIKWNDDTKEFEHPDRVSFHLRKNVGVNNSQCISNYSAANWEVHPKYIEQQSTHYNIAVVKIYDPKNELSNVKPLQLIESAKNYQLYSKAKVFGFSGVWNQELFGVKGDMECLDGKVIIYKSIICRGRGGPIFCDDEKSKDDNKQEQKMNNDSTKAFQLLNMGMDIHSVMNEISNDKNSDIQTMYNRMYKHGAYRPSTRDKEVYNEMDSDYFDIFNCCDDEVIGISLGEEGLFLYDELLDWIKNCIVSQANMNNTLAIDNNMSNILDID